MQNTAKSKIYQPTVFYSTYAAPIGTLHLYATEAALIGLYFRKSHQPVTQSLTVAATKPKLVVKLNPILKQTTRQLDLYFRGKLTQFDLPVAMSGTEFQHKAWQSLIKIPYGQTRSYAEQAKLAGAPRATRAIGSANGQNPISIIVPCHRVVRTGGTLGGYGGGLSVKRQLLDLEAKSCADKTWHLSNHSTAHSPNSSTL